MGHQQGSSHYLQLYVLYQGELLYRSLPLRVTGRGRDLGCFRLTGTVRGAN